MFPYWFFFLIPAIVILVNRPLTERYRIVGWAAIWLFFSLAIGLRFEVGGDWSSYLYHLELRSRMSLGDILVGSDPGYYFINWLVV